MSAVVVIGALWTLLAVGLAVVLGGAVRLADSKEAAARRGLDPAVAGDRSGAPVPVGAMAGAPAVPLARHPLDDR